MIILQQNENIINITPFQRLQVSISKYYTNKKDEQMKAVLDLKLFGDRLKDLKIEMEEISKILSDPKSSLCDRKSYTNIIKNTIQEIEILVLMASVQGYFPNPIFRRFSVLIMLQVTEGSHVLPSSPLPG